MPRSRILDGGLTFRGGFKSCVAFRFVHNTFLVLRINHGYSADAQSLSDELRFTKQLSHMCSNDVNREGGVRPFVRIPFVRIPSVRNSICQNSICQNSMCQKFHWSEIPFVRIPSVRICVCTQFVSLSWWSVVVCIFSICLSSLSMFRYAPPMSCLGCAPPLHVDTALHV